MDGISALIVGFGAGCLTGLVFRLWPRLRRERRSNRGDELPLESP
jgi:hypothetical protein